MKLKGHLTTLGVCAPTKGRKESNELYETLQKVLDKVNKNDYIMLIGGMNAQVGNNKITYIVHTNGET
jgi:preprotein translocase subunit YajC